MLVVTGIVSLILFGYFLNEIISSNKENDAWFLFVPIFIALVRLWYNILFKIKDVKFDDGNIALKNKLTRQNKSVKNNACYYITKYLLDDISLLDEKQGTYTKITQKLLFKY